MWLITENGATVKNNSVFSVSLLCKKLLPESFPLCTSHEKTETKYLGGKNGIKKAIMNDKHTQILLWQNKLGVMCHNI